jgi:hypothetical protein
MTSARDVAVLQAPVAAASLVIPVAALPAAVLAVPVTSVTIHVHNPSAPLVIPVAALPEAAAGAVAVDFDCAPDDDTAAAVVVTSSGRDVDDDVAFDEDIDDAAGAGVILTSRQVRLAGPKRRLGNRFRVGGINIQWQGDAR